MKKKYPPLLKVFSTTKENYYVYDVPTGRIFQCDKLTAGILDKYYGKVSNAEIINQYGPCHTSKVSSIIKTIEKLSDEEGVFRPAPPFSFEDPLPIGPVGKTMNLILEVTRNCNLRCDYCIFTDAYPTFRKHTTTGMSFDIAIKAIDLLVEMTKSIDDHLIIISFYGGEPCLEFDLIKRVIEEVKIKYPSKAFGFSLTTNGTIFNEEILSVLVKHDFNLAISLDGPKHIHDAHRRTIDNKGTFDKVMKTLNTIRMYSKEFYEKNVIIQGVLSPPLLLKERANFFASNDDLFGRNLIRTTPQMELGIESIDKNTRMLAHKEYDDAWNEYETKIRAPEFCRKSRFNIDNKFWSYLFDKNIQDVLMRFVSSGPQRVINRLDCLQHWTRLFVSAEGNLYCCIPSTYYEDESYKVGTVFGGIDNKKIEEISNHWWAFLKDECSRCWVSRLCTLCFPFMQREKDKQKRDCEYLRLHFEKWMSRVARLQEERFDIPDIFFKNELNEMV